MIGGELLRISECQGCVEHFLAPEQMFLAGACASVGVERKMSTLDVMRRYFEVFHAGGHRRLEGGVLVEAAKRVVAGE